MVLYDQFGRPIERGVNTTGTLPEGPQEEKGVGRGLRRAVRRLRGGIATIGLGWKGLLAVLGILASLAGLYAIRPIVTASFQTPPDKSPKYFAYLTITNSGQLPISDVHVVCDADKVVFSGRNTLRMNGSLTLVVDSATRLVSGESFNTFCTQPWFLYSRSTDAIISFGRLSPPIQGVGKDNTDEIGMEFILPEADQARSLIPVHLVKIPPQTDPLRDGYSLQPVTAIDANLVVTYKVFGLPRRKRIHLVGLDLGNFDWSMEAEGQNIPSDGIGGFDAECVGQRIVLTSDGQARDPSAPFALQ